MDDGEQVQVLALAFEQQAEAGETVLPDLVPQPLGDAATGRGLPEQAFRVVEDSGYDPVRVGG